MKRPFVFVLLGLSLVVGLGAGLAVASVAGIGTAEAGEVDNARLAVGDPAPDFRLPDHTGGYVRLSDFQGESHVVLAFYPLAWTPV